MFICRQFNYTHSSHLQWFVFLSTICVSKQLIEAALIYSSTNRPHHTIGQEFLTHQKLTCPHSESISHIGPAICNSDYDFKDTHKQNKGRQLNVQRICCYKGPWEKLLYPSATAQDTSVYLSNWYYLQGTWICSTIIEKKMWRHELKLDNHASHIHCNLQTIKFSVPCKEDMQYVVKKIKDKYEKSALTVNATKTKYTCVRREVIDLKQQYYRGLWQL